MTSAAPFRGAPQVRQSSTESGLKESQEEHFQVPMGQHLLPAVSLAPAVGPPRRLNRPGRLGAPSRFFFTPQNDVWQTDAQRRNHIRTGQLHETLSLVPHGHSSSFLLNGTTKPPSRCQKKCLWRKGRRGVSIRRASWPVRAGRRAAALRPSSLRHESRPLHHRPGALPVPGCCP